MAELVGVSLGALGEEGVELEGVGKGELEGAVGEAVGEEVGAEGGTYPAGGTQVMVSEPRPAGEGMQVARGRSGTVRISCVQVESL